MLDIKEQTKIIARRCKNKGLDYDECILLIKTGLSWAYAGGNPVDKIVADIYKVDLTQRAHEALLARIDWVLENFQWKNKP